MTNRFKDPVLRKGYDNATACFEEKHRNLFCADGSRSMGNSMASFFWRGFDGTQFGAGFTDAASKKTLAYAYSYYRAGQDCAKAVRRQREERIGGQQGALDIVERALCDIVELTKVKKGDAIDPRRVHEIALDAIAIIKRRNTCM